MSDARLPAAAPAPTSGGLHGQVLDAVGLGIVDGRIQAGRVVDPQDLMRDFGVSRSVVREALRVLQSLGLVTARPRVGTQVLPRDRWDLLAPSVIRWRGASSDYFTQQREMLQLRLGVEPVAAGLAASAASAGREAVVTAARDMCAAVLARDDRAYLDADVRFHTALLTASGNAVFTHFAGTVEALLRTRTSERRDTITGWTPAAAERHLVVGEAVAAGDAARAVDGASDLVRITLEEFVAETPH